MTRSSRRLRAHVLSCLAAGGLMTASYTMAEARPERAEHHERAQRAGKQRQAAPAQADRGARRNADRAASRGRDVNANRSVNRSANRNTNVNVNRNVSVNRNVNVHYSNGRYYDRRYNDGRYYRGGRWYRADGSLFAAAVVAGATAAVVGSMIYSLPPACSPYDIYYRCGSVWYERRYLSGRTTYVVVETPPGY